MAGWGCGTVGFALCGEHVSEHGCVRGALVASHNGFDDALVLESRGRESDAGERDAACLLLEFGHGSDHQRQDTISGEFGDAAVKLEIRAHGCFHLVAGVLHAGEKGPEPLRIGVCYITGGATSEFGFDEHAGLGKLPQPLVKVGECAQESRAHGCAGVVHDTYAYTVLHLEQSLDFEPLDRFPKGGAAHAELLGEIAFGGQPFVFTELENEALAYAGDNGNTFDQRR